MIKISWDEYAGMVEQLNAKILSAFPDQGLIHLIGVPRGGLILALYLTYLDKRYELVNPFKCTCGGRVHPPSNVLLVDDVLETGKTFTEWKNWLRLGPSLVTAVLIDKSKCYGHTPADVSVRSMDEKIWASFPYEKIEDEQMEADKCYKGEQT